MRVTVGAIAVLGLAVTVAAAQPPQPHERAAVLLPPVALPASAAPLVARGAAEELSPSPQLGSTPVTRRNAPAGRAPNPGAGPDWLTGVDPNVLPAAGLGVKGGSGVRPLSPAAGASAPRDQSSFITKGLDKFKGSIAADPKSKQQPPLSQPFTQPGAQQPTASTPFRGTSSSGAPVYAGPPAYRWYGWGSVTPGANAFAPDGQYPKASANWYSITGATPGAFPVPVMNPMRPAPGAEPPAYAHSRPTAGTQPTASLPIQRPDRPELAHRDPQAGSKFMPAPGPDAPPVGIPTISAPPGTKSVAAAPAVPYVSNVEPIRAPTPVTGAKPLGTSAPSPLPTSVTEDPKPDEQRWESAGEPATAPAGTWAPANGSSHPARPADPPSNWSGNRNVKPAVARGQLGDGKPDPIATVIRRVCQGRAEAVEVRWTGSKKLTVCFEVRGAADAQKLVNDISQRPEVGPYQIDFCVLVK